LKRFLAVSKKDLVKRGIETPDFVLVSGDAYIDHHSFAMAIVGRWLEAFGFSVGIISQPDFTSCESYKVFGKPKYAFLVSPGNMDSMVNLYTVNKRPRKKDNYTPGGETGKRPKRASISYSNRIREAYGDVPIIIGGIEPSLRRFAHYDYWEDKVRNSILFDSGANLLIYGMGEKPLKEIAEYFESGMKAEDMTFIKGTCYIASSLENVYDYTLQSSAEEVSKDKKKYAESFKIQYRNQDYRNAKSLVQQHGDKYIVQNPPCEPLSVDEMDTIYSLPFNGQAHPMYKEHIPALDEVKFSITSSRGCVGGCAFCAINFHQGREISKRSVKSIVSEAKTMSESEDFKGYIHDVGGPTANFYEAYCKREGLTPCNRLCLYPDRCKNLNISHEEYLKVLRSVRNLPKVKKVFIRSGLRFDYMVYDKKSGFIEELAKHHVSGQLRTAPEHVSCDVLELMNKPGNDLYKEFLKLFEKADSKAKKNQYVLPYFISSHPGSTLGSAIELAEYMNKEGFIPEQVQDFYPTPGTLSTCMYYTGINPLDGKGVYVPRTNEEKKMQRALLQFNKSKNRALVKKALIKEKRYDLIGKGKNCLVRE